MCRLVVLHILCIFIQIPLCYSQVLSDSYMKIDCKISKSHKSNDTIFAFKSENCNLSDVKVEDNGFWMVYSKEDTSSVIESFRIIDKQVEGLRYFKNGKDESYYINYSNGKYHGPYMHLSSSNKPILFVNYLDGMPSSDYYFYSYEEEDKLLTISQYSKKGNLKRKELIEKEKKINNESR